MPVKPSSSSTDGNPLDPPVLPTEAEVRTADLEQQQGASDGAAPGSDPGSADADDRESRIRRAAYASYVRRGSVPGHEVEDWLEAERTVDAGTPGDDANGGGRARGPFGLDA